MSHFCKVSPLQAYLKLRLLSSCRICLLNSIFYDYNYNSIVIINQKEAGKKPIVIRENRR